VILESQPVTMSYPAPHLELRHGAVVDRVLFSGDGSTLVVATVARVVIWDAHTGARKRCGLAGVTFDIDVSHDGSVVVALGLRWRRRSRGDEEGALVLDLNHNSSLREARTTPDERARE